MSFSWSDFGLICVPVILIAIFVSLLVYHGKDVFLMARKPTYSIPPLFHIIIWFLIYVLTAVAGSLTYSNLNDSDKKRQFLAIFYISLLLNFVWFLSFFVSLEPRFSIIILLALMASLLYLIWASWNVSIWAVSLFIIYLFWCLFVSFLNVGYVSVNYF